MTASRTSAQQSRAAKLADARAHEQAAQLRRRRQVIAAVVIVVLVLVVGVGALVQSQRTGTTASTGTPAGTTGVQSQSFVVGKAAAPVTVTVYEDFQCPACKAFEALSGATLADFVAKGTVKVEYRPVAILDRYSTTSYSTRALSAAGCVIAVAPQRFTRFHELLFANQPAENSAGLDDARLTALGQQAGADIGTCITAKTYRGWAARATDQASKDGLAGTPTVKVDGTVVDDPTPQVLTAAIEAAAE